jgi:hypothetical protein
MAVCKWQRRRPPGCPGRSTAVRRPRALGSALPIMPQFFKLHYPRIVNCLFFHHLRNSCGPPREMYLNLCAVECTSR